MLVGPKQTQTTVYTAGDANRSPDREALPELRRLRDNAIDSDADQPTDAPPAD